MVAVNLLASLITTNNVCTSICLNIIACITSGEFRVILYAITLVVFCRLSDMRSPLRGDVSCSSEIKLACYSVPSNFVFLHSLFPNIASIFGLSSSASLK